MPGSGLRSNVPKTATHGKVGLNLHPENGQLQCGGQDENNGCSGLRKGFAETLSPTTHYTIVRRPIAKCRYSEMS